MQAQQRALSVSVMCSMSRAAVVNHDACFVHPCMLRNSSPGCMKCKCCFLTGPFRQLAAIRVNMVAKKSCVLGESCWLHLQDALLTALCIS